MGCSVYCLAPSAEATERLVGRARQAGIPAEDIRVVVRRKAGERRREAQRATHTRWWSASLTPAALWWVAALYTWPAVVRTPVDEEGRSEVITLEQYRAGRGSAR